MGTSADSPRAPRYPPVRHLRGPFAPPWYVRRERVLRLVLMVAFVDVVGRLRRAFMSEALYRLGRPVLRAGRVYELSYVLVPLVGVVVLARRRIVAGVRERLRVLDDVHARGGWWAAGVTGALNVVYVLAFVGPGRWAAAEAYTAYAVGSEHFLAADEVVAQAVVQYFDRGTALALVAMVVEAALFHVVARRRRRYGVAD